MYRINQNQEIISLLLKIKEVEEEYPPDLLTARRAQFLLLLTRYIGAWIRVERIFFR
jgi:hypothetical protein